MSNPGSIIRWISAAGGILSLCAGLAVLVAPPIGGALHWPWDDEILLVAFFVVVFVIASLLLPFVLLDDSDRADRTPPEPIPSTPPPGRELEHVLDRRWPLSLPPARRHRIRDGLRRTTIRTIVRTEGCATETARDHLADGTWTDDPVAAAFVRPEPESDGSLLRSLRERLYFARRARRTARAVLTLAAEEARR
ncbi:DUF7269 family protein [Natrialba aegyptia]|uniref:Uncharacterized protein n=1 Tax=Natrialba aegyptia DSM 13077 TaxID=1227491 RepID=M0B902_9EURY|nr:hypothetical protein [Natrialba aegyptia]ELZ07300.1 hypothetical protein C480_04571 [Natrialba aegyptia DSM 13077]